MSVRQFRKRSIVEAPADEVFRWHARPGAFERLTPPWEKVEVLERTGGIENGARVVLRIPIGPLSVRWVAEHRDYVEGRQFRDVQVEGPFARWEHTHRMDPARGETCWLEDHIRYELPVGFLGDLAAGASVSTMLKRTFDYRHRTTAGDIAAHRAHEGPPLHFLVTGASGLVGSALVPFLTTGGHRVTRVVRSERGGQDVVARDASGRLDLGRLDPIDAVVHLAGENVAGGRWTTARKAAIRDSRVEGTRTLCEALACLPHRPRVLVCASAVGYYGDRGAAVIEEDGASGEGFLAEVCRDWEAATEPARAAGIRVVNLRTGVVLSSAGGALAQMLRPFRLGVGGRLGSGRQYVSWVGRDDVLAAILHVVRADELEGAVNAVAPSSVTNAELTATLARVLRRPALLPVPASVLRAALGEMADEMLLASARVAPARLLATGYRFRNSDLEDALRLTLGR